MGNNEVHYLEGQIMWWKTWQQAKGEQIRIANAVYNQEIAVSDEILKQLERRMGSIKEANK